MKQVFQFVLVFLVAYTAIILLVQSRGAEEAIHSFAKSAVQASLKSFLPEAYIEIQDVKSPDGKMDLNSFYVVYGNPATIQAEQLEAQKQNASEYRISTYSFTLFLFQLFTVPIVFVCSLFIATPMEWKKKLKFIAVSLLIILCVIFLKCILLALFNIANAGIGIYALTEGQMNLTVRVVSMLSLGFSIITGFVLWLVFGFRNSHLMNLFNDFVKSFQS